MGATQGMVGLHESKDGKDIYIECTVYTRRLKWEKDWAMQQREGRRARRILLACSSSSEAKKQTHLNLHLGP